MGWLEEPNLLLSILESRKSKTKAPADPLYGASTLPLLQTTTFSFSSSPIGEEEGRASYHVFSYKDTNCTPHDLITSQKPSSCYYHIGG